MSQYISYEQHLLEVECAARLVVNECLNHECTGDVSHVRCQLFNDTRPQIDLMKHALVHYGIEHVVGCHFGLLNGLRAVEAFSGDYGDLGCREYCAGAKNRVVRPLYV